MLTYNPLYNGSSGPFTNNQAAQICLHTLVFAYRSSYSQDKPYTQPFGIRSASANQLVLPHCEWDSGSPQQEHSCFLRNGGTSLNLL